MKKIIICDAANETVTVIRSGKNPERTFEKWCEKNGVHSGDCNWMEFRGEIKDWSQFLGQIKTEL